ncbi:MAG: hypothetical protein CK424_07105 [Legionella sp.]|nr:MAG: hypothetical protein CK424_07105 [Legionella sp.]
MWSKGFEKIQTILKPKLSLITNKNYTTIQRSPSGDYVREENLIRTIPNTSGYVIQITHDQKETESSEVYSARCQSFVKQHIKPGCYTFFVCATVITGNEATRKQIKQKFFDKTVLSTEEIKHITPGHIAVYTTEGHFISYRRQSKRKVITQDESIAIDVKGSISEKQQVSTYLAVIPRHLFPNCSIIGAHERADMYHLNASDDPYDKKDNCATVIQKEFLNKKYREKMNPIATFLSLIVAAYEASQPTKKHKEHMLRFIRETGIGRQLDRIHEDEKRYKNNPIPEKQVDFTF